MGSGGGGGGGMGAVLGTVAGGPIGGLIGGGLGMSQDGSNKAARAAQGAAEERYKLAAQYWDKSAGRLDDAYNEFKGYSIQDMMKMDDIIAKQDKNLARQEQMISQIDPTVLEASQQALKLLRGETSSALAPLQNQRNTERQKLVNQLRAQLGPGAETSTAGIQALTRFDAQTSQLMAGAQQSALGQLGNTATQFSALRPNISGELGALANMSGRRLSTAGGIFDAEMNRTQQRRIDFAPVIGGSGAQFVGDQMRGMAQQQMGNQLMSAGFDIGGKILGAGLTGGFGGFGGLGSKATGGGMAGGGGSGRTVDGAASMRAYDE